VTFEPYFIDDYPSYGNVFISIVYTKLENGEITYGDAMIAGLGSRDEVVLENVVSNTYMALYDIGNASNLVIEGGSFLEYATDNFALVWIDGDSTFKDSIG
jgi:hypothetical protein